MAIIGFQNPTLADVAKMVDDDGKMLDIVELLNQTNELLTDMGWVQCNNGTKHKTSIRTGLPESVWRRFYQGVPNSKSKRASVEETTAQLSTRSAVDEDLARISGNVGAFRLQEATAFTESMNQSMAEQILYGSSQMYPDRFNGLAPRYNSLSSMVGKSNVISGGGNGSDNTSIWLVVWGPSTVHGLYPNGQVGGLQHEDLGIGDVLDDEGNPYRAYQDLWKWDCGVCVRDWRYVVRIANVDVSNLMAETGAADLIKLMTMALHRIPQMGMGRAAFYANRTVVEALDIQTQDKSQNTVVSGNDVFGRPALTCRGVPIRKTDAILNTEDAVTA